MKSIESSIYSAQISSKTPQYSGLEKGDKLELMDVNTKEFGNNNITTIVYKKQADGQRIRFSVNMLEKMDIADGKSITEESDDDATRVELARTITIDAVKDTKDYGIRDYTGFDAAFETAKKDWTNMTAELYNEVRESAPKATAQPIQAYEVSVSHDIKA
tara:strand:- start:42 stop:521 length:480 start_codon:yes stop_codon:yes gene_type:complete